MKIVEIETIYYRLMNVNSDKVSEGLMYRDIRDIMNVKLYCFYIQYY